MRSAQSERSPVSIWRGLRGDVSWQLSERAIRIGLGFLLSVIIARSLGPSGFGIYSYAVAIVAIFAFLGQAGLDALLLRELMRLPNRSAQSLSEGLTLRLLGAVLAGLASVATALLFASSNMKSATPLVAILALSGIFQAGWVVDSWLQANNRFKQAALAKILAYTASAVLRLLALRLSHPLPALAAVTVIESGLCTLLMWKVSSHHLALGIKALRLPKSQHLIDLARLVSPMLFSALTIAIYSRIDVFMLGRMLGSEAAGLYTAGTLLSEGFYVIPMALMTAAAPRLTLLFSQDPARFESGMYRLLRILSTAGLVIALTVTLLAPFVVPRLFGSGFVGATGILQIHIWSTWAVFVSSASDPWYINHDLRRLYLVKTSTAAVLNIVLNLLLIPRWHGEGAAMATVIAYAVSAFGTGILWPQTRPLFLMQLRAVVGYSTR